MNVSRGEQRTLHALAQGGAIQVEKDIKGKIAKAICYTRDGWALADCTLGVFKRLKTRPHHAGGSDGGATAARQPLMR